jgi:hypothetical protein
MRRIASIALGALLIAASTAQIAAAEHRHARKPHRLLAIELLRNANNSVVPYAQSDWYSGYGGGISAPAGR